MICRRCGAEIPDNSIRCTNCGIKVNMRCPECKTLNPFGVKNCKNCGFELLKSCPSCNSLNIYLAKECRKCHTPFSSFDVEEYQPEKNQETIEKKKTSDFEIVRSFTSQNSTFNSVPYEEPSNITQEENIDEEAVDNSTINNQDKIFNVEEAAPSVLAEENTEQSNEKENMIEDVLLEIENVVPIEEITDDIEIEQDSSEEDSAEMQNQQSNQDDEDNEEELDIEVQPAAVIKTLQLVKSSLKQIIAINGPEGSGKSAVLRQVNDNLSKSGYISLYGSCTPLIQITSFGFFQDAFLRLMGFPPFATSTESFIKDFKKSNFAKVFSFLSGSELSLFLNVFYPSQKDNFENILENKKQMFSILEKIIKSFVQNENIIISIDNFELLDGASYEFILYMMEKGFFNSRLKLLVSYQENKSIQSYFDSTGVDEKIFETIVLKKFSKEELVDVINKTMFIEIDKIIDAEYLDELLQKADGNAIRMEQEIALLFDSGYIALKDNDILINEENKPEVSPVSFDELIKLRINSLNPAAKTVLYMSAIMGYRFASSILCLAVTMPVKKAEQMLDYLHQEMFIQKVDNYTFEFKSLTLWKLIYQEAKADLLYKENSERLYISLKPLILSSNLQKLISCSEALSKNESFLIWQNTSSIAAKLGDTNLYIIAQKQCLKLIEEQDITDAEEVKAQIYEEIGKLLCEKSPKEAVTYLANVLDAEIKASNYMKVIDLSGYFIKSCYLTGNYFGVTEAVDSITKGLDSIASNTSDLELALIKTRKLRALLNIGNSEQIINLVNEEIIPVLDREINAKQPDVQYKTLVINAWLLSKITLAKAYALQGNNSVNQTISELKTFVEKTNNNSMYYSTQISIIEAFANTVTGEINKSNEILNKLALSYKNKTMETNLLAEWNLLNIINRILSGQNKDLKADLFEFAAFTNNINEHFIKNIVKLLLGYIIKEEGNSTKALEIFNEEITYFAKEKVATGALLSWALIVQLYLATGEDDKALNTASKSLEIAQSPKINNYFFTIYFQKYLAEIYSRKTDFTAAKMYLEKSLMLAKQYDLKYQLVDLYINYAKSTEELMKSKHIYSAENTKLVLDMYNKAVLTAKELQIPKVIETAVQARAAFKTFCQLNSIEI